MPVNKAAQFRLEIIDECLRNTKKKWSKTEILRYVNRKLESYYGQGAEISLSQLRYDIEHLQTAYGAPIEMYREGRGYYYRYEDGGFSIRNIPVHADDFIKLHTAVNVLKQLKGFTLAEQIEEVISKMEQKYQQKSAENNWILFDHSPYMKGLENLEDLFHSISHQNVLKIKYKPYKSTADTTCIVHPYLLKEYNHQWYLLGLNDERLSIGTYALDRITDIRVVNKKYIKNISLDPDTYFADIVGVTKPKRGIPQDIHLLFTPTLAPYVLSKPIHHSQKTIECYKDGSIHVKVTLIVNPELISLLMSFGKEMIVILPDVLSLEIRASALTLLSNYAL